MFYIDSTYLLAQTVGTADLETLGGDFHTLRSLRDEWDFLLIDDEEGLFRI